MDHHSTLLKAAVSSIELAVEIHKNMGTKATLREFKEALTQGEKYKQRIDDLKTEVEAFAARFPMPGMPEL